MTHNVMTHESPQTCPALRRIDTTTPHAARVRDYWLGGTDNFPPDREIGDEILRVTPDLAINVRAEWQFIGRVVPYLAGPAGIDQFLAVGTGIPASGNTHQVAQRVNPAARTVYVDNDPAVLVHAREVLRSPLARSTDYIDADLCDPEPILEAATDTLDFARPIALMLMGVLEFVSDDTLVHDVVGVLTDALPSGSYLALASNSNSPAMRRAAAVWNAVGSPSVTLRTPKQLEGIFAGFDLIPPGVVSLPRWRPTPCTSYTDREIFQHGGLARKP